MAAFKPTSYLHPPESEYTPATIVHGSPNARADSLSKQLSSTVLKITTQKFKCMFASIAKQGVADTTTTKGTLKTHAVQHVAT